MLDTEVNGVSTPARQGKMLLSALNRASIHVPTLCHMQNLVPSGACRMCVVEVELGYTEEMAIAEALRCLRCDLEDREEQAPGE